MNRISPYGVTLFRHGGWNEKAKQSCSPCGRLDCKIDSSVEETTAPGIVGKHPHPQSGGRVLLGNCHFLGTAYLVVDHLHTSGPSTAARNVGVGGWEGIRLLQKRLDSELML